MGLIELAFIKLAFETIEKVIDLLIEDEGEKKEALDQLASVKSKIVKDSEVA